MKETYAGYQELLNLEPLFEKYKGLSAMQTPHFLHGFLVGIASDPQLNTPSEWLKSIKEEINWDSEDDFHQVSSVCESTYNDCLERMREGTLGEFFPQELTFDRHEWSKGYITGFQFWGDEIEFDEELDGMISAILFNTLTDEEQQNIIQETKEELNIDELPTPTEFAEIIFGELEDMEIESGESISPLINEEDKVGRNDPCACGSGKKYKKCCGRT